MIKLRVIKSYALWYKIISSHARGFVPSAAFWFWCDQSVVWVYNTLTWTFEQKVYSHVLPRIVLYRIEESCVMPMCLALGVAFSIMAFLVWECGCIFVAYLNYILGYFMLKFCNTWFYLHYLVINFVCFWYDMTLLLGHSRMWGVQ